MENIERYFGSNTVINCKTRKEYDYLLNQIISIHKPSNCDVFKNYNGWDKYKESVCLCLDEWPRLMYGPIESYEKDEKVKIINTNGEPKYRKIEVIIKREFKFSETL